MSINPFLERATYSTSMFYREGRLSPPLAYAMTIRFTHRQVFAESGGMQCLDCLGGKPELGAWNRVRRRTAPTLTAILLGKFLLAVMTALVNAIADHTAFQFYSPPIILDEPPEIQEDHVTFLLGIVLLISVAVGCIFTLSRIGRPRYVVYILFKIFIFIVEGVSVTTQRDLSYSS